MTKKRKAKRQPRTRILERQSKRLYGTGYMEYLERLGITTRNKFYGQLKRRTLSDDTAEEISRIFKVDTEDWYDGKKLPKVIRHDPDLNKVHIVSTTDFLEDLNDII